MQENGGKGGWRNADGMVTLSGSDRRCGRRATSQDVAADLIVWLLTLTALSLSIMQKKFVF